MSIRTIGIFLVCIGVSLLAGFWGSTATAPSIAGWYSTLNKPFWTPPNWVFMPVWTLLYILMGVSIALVWKTGRPKVFLAVLFFLLHLAVNVWWSITFFGSHDIFASLIIIKTLWVMIAIMMLWFWRFSKMSTYLLAPYLAWVSYATTLNLGILVLNP